MSKIKVHKPVLIAQSADAPILWGGYQIPRLRIDDQKRIFVKFNNRMDSVDTYSVEHLDPVFVSTDGGETFSETTNEEWIKAATTMPNGEKIDFIHENHITEYPELPPLPEYRKNIYTVEELNPILGEKIEKSIKIYRIVNGEIRKEKANFIWKNMPVEYVPNKRLSKVIVGYDERPLLFDENNVMWITCYCKALREDGKPISGRCATHILKSEDFGHTFEYVSSIPYMEHYNREGTVHIEGFNETALILLGNGRMAAIIRSGTQSSKDPGNPETKPSPYIFITRSSDNGKTWETPKPLYDFGVQPRAIKFPNGPHLMSSGRPGVYIRASYDENAEIWDEPIFVLKVPDEERWTGYYNYSCSNTDLKLYDEKTAFIAYSDFTMNDKDGRKLKSIMVSKITLED